MNECKEIQKLIVPFENNGLTLKQEEHFVKHLEKCNDCREEFEIYYIIAYGLEENEHIDESDPKYKEYLNSFDFKSLIDLKIQNSKKKILSEHKHNRRNWISYTVTNICLMLTILLLYIIIYF